MCVIHTKYKYKDIHIYIYAHTKYNYKGKYIKVCIYTLNTILKLEL